ncbi:MAG: DUF1697 domain-containing protein [Bacteroidota bacterium]
MNTYIALLRGINVSGQKKIRMAELREQLAELPYENIRTYIQSGNIVFDSQNENAAQLAQEIRNKIAGHYAFDVPTLIRTPEELREAAQNNPFAAEDLKRVYLTFLESVPAQAQIDVLAEVDYSPEQYVIQGKSLYLFSPDGRGTSKLSNNLFEKKLKVNATTRNWRTLNKLIEMAG